MKFALVIHGAPQSSAAPTTALHFARAVVSQGHELYRVFFYHEGVLTGNRLRVTPQDEPDVHAEWVAFSEAHKVELVVCVASALRRGMLDETEAARSERGVVSLDPAFTISGLGQLIDAGLNADRLVTFQP